MNSLEELVLFDSNINIESESTGIPISFILLKGHRAELYQDAAERHLEIARRDFLALFEMHRDGLGFNRSAKSKKQLLWKEPTVEISRFMIDGDLKAMN